MKQVRTDTLRGTCCPLATADLAQIFVRPFAGLLSRSFYPRLVIVMSWRPLGLLARAECVEE